MGDADLLERFADGVEPALFVEAEHRSPGVEGHLVNPVLAKDLQHLAEELAAETTVFHVGLDPHLPQAGSCFRLRPGDYTATDAAIA